MKRILYFLLFSSLAFSQSAGVGQIWSVVSGSLQSGATANGNGTSLAVSGLSVATLTVNCSAACTGGTTINFEGSEDNTNFVALNAAQLGTSTISTTILNQGTTPTVWSIGVAGLQSIRARISGYSAGTITVTGHATATPTSGGSSTVSVNNGTTDNGTPRVTLSSDSTGQVKLATGANTIGALAADQSINVDQVHGTAADTNSGTKSAGTLRVVLATDQPALTSKLLVTPDSVALPANQSVNVNQVAGTTVDTNSGNKSAGTQRMVIATDQPNLTTALNVALAANQSVNVAQINGVTALMGNGTAGTGSQRVTIASDNTAFGVKISGNAGGAFDAATGAAPPANDIAMGGLASGATGGLMANLTVCDQWVAINGTASAQLIAGVSGRKIYFCGGNIQMNGGANTVSFVSGTGSTCATGITAIPGFDGATTAANGYSFAANSGMGFGAGLTPFARTTNNADNFCILVGSATRVVGGLSYAIY